MTSWEEKMELVEATHANYLSGDITEAEYRLKLAAYGFNATEIEAEIEFRRDARDKLVGVS